MRAPSEPVIAAADDCAVVWLAGEVGLTVRMKALQAIERALTLMDVPHLIVDVSGVTLMDSTGLSVLLAAHKNAEARGGSVSVLGASDRIRRLLHMVGLDDVITVLPRGARLLRDAVPAARARLPSSGGTPPGSATV